MPPYTIQTHRHRFAVWTSARAVARNFTSTTQIKKAIEFAGLRTFVESGNGFSSQDSFDVWHSQTCSDILQYWINEPVDAKIKNPSFGRAAKVVAIYLKTMIGLGEVDAHPMQKWMHPPIDRILLDNMRTELGYKVIDLPNWTQLDSDDYADVLSKISTWMKDNRPKKHLWEAEEFWGEAE